MFRIRHAAAFAASLALACPAVSWAQNDPTIGGDYVEVTSVTVDDGHDLDYINFLKDQWRSQNDYSKSQGWITGYEILGNVDKRPGEADLYLVRRFRSMPDGVEGDKRAATMRAHMALSDAQMSAASGDRAKFRHILGSQLLQVISFK